MARTAWLPENYSVSARLQVLEEGFTSDTFPRCHCGAYVGFRRSNHKKLKTTCDEHKPSRDLEVSITREELLDLRINQRLSKDAIADILKISAPTVSKLLKKHAIPDVRYNESDAAVSAILNDRDWLETEHVHKRRKLQEIAAEIGSSPATVSRFMEMHGIETNDPLGYDRPGAFSSRPCQEVAAYIESLGFEVHLNVRSIIAPLELDIYVPSKNLAIEFNGLFFHSFRPEESSWAARKGPDYHLAKTEACEQQGIHLFHIFEDSWSYKTEIVKSMLKSKLGVNERVFARKCSIVEVPFRVRKRFFEDNHIQGDSRCQICYGLEIGGRLVACMSFGKSRFNKKYQWELVRFASTDVNVVGGFSKLLKHFRSRHPGSIISYADRTHSQGTVYRTNGFELVSQTKGNFWYVDSRFSKRLHRAAFVKKRIAPGDPRSGRQVMYDNGYRQIFGCGTQAWVLR